jgi:cell division protein FtsZ
VIVSVAGGSDLTLHEVSAAASVIHALVDEDASIIFGSTLDESLSDTVRVTVIANGHAHASTVMATAEPPPRPFNERLNEPAYLRRRALG